MPHFVKSAATAVSFAAFLLLLGGCEDVEEEDHDGSLVNETNEPYRPGLHALMIEMQFRHANLWFAGEAENWQLTDHQLHEMEELADDIVELHPVYREARVGELMAMITPALEAIEDAVEQRDADAFRDGFDRLTSGCNACHEATDQEAIVIQRPQTPPIDNLRYEAGGR